MSLQNAKNYSKNKKSNVMKISISLICLLIVAMVAIIVLYNKSYLVISSRDTNVDNENI